MYIVHLNISCKFYQQQLVIVKTITKFELSMDMCQILLTLYSSLSQVVIVITFLFPSLPFSLSDKKCSFVDISNMRRIARSLRYWLTTQQQNMCNECNHSIKQDCLWEAKHYFLILVNFQDMNLNIIAVCLKSVMQMWFTESQKQ